MQKIRLILDTVHVVESEKYIDKYMHGWDKVREERHARLIQQGIIPSKWQCSPRDEHSPSWESVTDKEWEASRMACYAAQITIMDRGIGRILDALRKTDQYDNTVIFFLSDNGGECVQRLFHLLMRNTSVRFNC
jgi:arylsulfatase A-like enzyme